MKTEQENQRDVDHGVAVKEDGLLGFILAEQKESRGKLNTEEHDHEKTGYTMDEPCGHVVIRPLGMLLLLDIGHPPLRFAHEIVAGPAGTVLVATFLHRDPVLDIRCVTWWANRGTGL
jgi:hypothetical protein